MAGEIVDVSWGAVMSAARRCAARNAGRYDVVYGVPMGGLIPAALVAEALWLDVVEAVLPEHGRVLVVDDLVDSGKTARDVIVNGAPAGAGFDALFRKATSPPELAPDADVVIGWAEFPWERARSESGPEDAIVRLLEFIGDDPTRDGLADTPARVVRSLREMTAGLRENPADVLGRTFAEKYDELIVVRGIDFTSLCEHHLLPFSGTVDVGYIPNGRSVVGLSKVARLVDVLARRPQIQERLTQQIADVLQATLGPVGVGVVVTARHACMAHRGVRKPNAEMVTSSMLGALRDKPAARAEFMALLD